MSDLLLVLER